MIVGPIYCNPNHNPDSDTNHNPNPKLNNKKLKKRKKKKLIYIYIYIYKKYNFDKIVLPYVKEVSPPIPDHILQIEGRDGILPVQNLDDINKKDMVSHPRYAFRAPSCGLAAFLYVVNELKADIINIVGLDFYDNTGYFTSTFGDNHGTAPTERAIERGEPTEEMQDFFKKIVISNSNVIFNIYTASKIESDVDNLKVINLEVI